MRFLKVILLILLFFFCLLFFIQNSEVLSTMLKLKFDLFVTVPGFGDGSTPDSGRLMWQSAEGVPFYFVVLTSFALGALFVTLMFLIGRMRLAFELSRRARLIKSLDKQVKQQEEEKTKAAKALEAAPPAPETPAAQGK